MTIKIMALTIIIIKLYKIVLMKGEMWLANKGSDIWYNHMGWESLANCNKNITKPSFYDSIEVFQEVKKP